MKRDTAGDTWDQWWEARVAACEALLGAVEPSIGHAAVPFDLGPEAGGAADVIYFRHKIPGVIAVIMTLIGIINMTLTAWLFRRRVY